MTAEYTNLVNNIRVIDTEFRTFNQADASLPENQRKLRACVSLMHSEFEAYFELTAGKVVNLFESNSMTKKQKGGFTYAISLYNHKGFEGQPERIADRIQTSTNYYKNSLAQNNGIKDKDILKILLSIGVPFDSIDSTWLTSISSFGALRGELMHKNINQITRLIGYRYIDETVYGILIPGTLKIDEFYVRVYGIA